MDDLKNLIKKETSNMFSETFYSSISNEILKLFNKQNNNVGYVYFIKNGYNSKNVRIGCALDIDKTVKSFTNFFDKNIFILGYIKCENFYNVEKELKSFFSDKKKIDKWFELNFYDFIEISNNYDFIEINDFCNSKILIEKMIKKNNDTSIVSFAKKLIVNKEYFTANLYAEFLKENPKKITLSWFGRELNKSIVYLGFNRKDLNKKGKRSFILN